MADFDMDPLTVEAHEHVDDIPEFSIDDLDISDISPK